MTKIILLFLCLYLLSCSSKNERKQNERRLNSTIKSIELSSEQALKLDTFSTFPKEIDGCSCYFSKDSIDFNKGNYIYMNNFAQTSFVKINGQLIRFTEKEHKKLDSIHFKVKFSAKNYKMTLESTIGRQNGDETFLETGTINITDMKGRTISNSFYGECGC